MVCYFPPSYRMNILEHLPDDLKFLVKVWVFRMLVNPLKGLLGGASLGKGHEEGLLRDDLRETHLHELLGIFLVNIATD